AQIVLVGTVVGGCKVSVLLQAFGHPGHHADGFQTAHGAHGTRVGQIEGRGERTAVGQSRGGPHHQGPAAAAARRDPDHAAGYAPELRGDGFQVTGVNLLRVVHSSTSPAIFVDSHTVRYQGPEGATSTGPWSLRVRSIGASSPVMT